jgi:hypothetical protein
MAIPATPPAEILLESSSSSSSEEEEIHFNARFPVSNKSSL